MDGNQYMMEISKGFRFTYNPKSCTNPYLLCDFDLLENPKYNVGLYSDDSSSSIY